VHNVGCICYLCLNSYTFGKHIFKADVSFGIIVLPSVHFCKDMLYVGPMDETFILIM
jgi:hypothetical protein